MSSVECKSRSDYRQERCTLPTWPTARMHTFCSRKQWIPLCWRMELSADQWWWECHCKSWQAPLPPCADSPWCASHFPHCPCSPPFAQWKTWSAMRLFEHQWHSCIQQRVDSFLQLWAPHPALQPSSWPQPSLWSQHSQKERSTRCPEREDVEATKRYPQHKRAQALRSAKGSTADLGFRLTSQGTQGQLFRNYDRRMTESQGWETNRQWFKC